MGGKMGGKTGGRASAFSAEFHARDGAIRNAIGRMLRAQYDVAEPLPNQLANLVKRLDRGAPQTQAAPGASARPLRKTEPAPA
jgi:hypothetical protein